MVRLEFVEVIQRNYIEGFQFLNGAIRINYGKSKNTAFNIFQFLNGAIRILPTHKYQQIHHQISIPQWCD